MSPTANFNIKHANLSKEPRFVVTVDFSSDGSDLIWFTSHDDITLPAGAFEIQAGLENQSTTSQDIKPEQAKSSIGSMSFTALNTLNKLRDFIGARRATGTSALNKKVVYYFGYKDLAFADYYKLQTQQVADIEAGWNGYELKGTDIQRGEKVDIFKTSKTNLAADYTAGDTTITVVATEGFEANPHGSEYSDTSVTFGSSVDYYYIIIKEESRYNIIRATGKTASTFTGCVGGRLGSLDFDVLLDPDAESDQQPLIEEHVYLEMAAPKMILGLLGYELPNQTGKYLPESWRASIAAEYVNYASFSGIGDDLWNPDDDTGLILEFQGEKKQELKKFIEEQVLMPSGCIMPIDTSGALNLGHITQVLADSPYIAVLDSLNITKMQKMTHHLTGVRNLISVDWNYDFFLEKFTRREIMVDGSSASAYDISDLLSLSFRGITGNLHTRTTLYNIYDRLRDRYSGEPLLLDVETHLSGATYQVGDLVRVQMDDFENYLNVNVATRGSVVTDAILSTGGAYANTGEYITHANKLLIVATMASTAVGTVTFHDTATGTIQYTLTLLTSIDDGHGRVLSIYYGVTGDQDIAGYFRWRGSYGAFHGFELNDTLLTGTNGIDAIIQYKEAAYYNTGGVPYENEVTFDNGFSNPANATLAFYGAEYPSFSGMYSAFLTDFTSAGDVGGRECGISVGLSQKEVSTVTATNSRDDNEWAALVALEIKADNVTMRPLNQTFEVQRVKSNWVKGGVSLKLFGSGSKAGSINRASTTTVISDDWYISEGTDIETALAGYITDVSGILHVDTNGGVLTCTDDFNDSASIYYSTKPVIIDADITLTWTGNLQLRLREAFDVKGIFTGEGGAVSPGQVGSVTAQGGVIISYGPTWVSITNSYQASSDQAFAAALPRYNIEWDGTILKGLPRRLDGVYGVPGADAILANGTVLAAGGTGTVAGGGGLVTIHRGFSASGSGKIITKGTAGAAGTIAFVNPYFGLNNFYFAGGAASGGAAGQWLDISDGSAAYNSVSASRIEMNNGACPSVNPVDTSGAVQLDIGTSDSDAVSSYFIPDTSSTSNSGFRREYVQDVRVAVGDIPDFIPKTPPDVTGFSVYKNGDNVIMQWTPVECEQYEIRIIEAGGTDAWDDASIVARILPNNDYASKNIYTGSWVYLIKALNGDKYSANADTSDVNFNSVYTTVYSNEEATTFGGTLTNMVRHHTGKLVPESQTSPNVDDFTVFNTCVQNPYSPVYYEINEYDMGSDADRRILALITGYMAPEASGIPDYSLEVDWKTAAGAYSGFRAWTVGEANFRYVKARVKVTPKSGVSIITGMKLIIEST